MALYYELPVYKDSYSLLLYLFRLTRNFNREYKYTIGQSMKSTGMELVLAVFKANSAKNKIMHFNELAEHVELIKLELRLCIDMRIITPAQQAEAWKYIESISRQVSGWKKATV